jgi:hypothetical protein
MGSYEDCKCKVTLKFSSCADNAIVSGILKIIEI